MIHEHLNPKSTSIYQPQMIEGARDVCKRLLQNPDDFMDHLRLWVYIILQKNALIHVQYGRGSDLIHQIRDCS